MDKHLITIPLFICIGAAAATAIIIIIT